MMGGSFTGDFEGKVRFYQGFVKKCLWKGASLTKGALLDEHEGRLLYWGLQGKGEIL
jgi:hypothetical protein